MSAAFSFHGFTYGATQIKFLYDKGVLETEPDRDFGALPGQKEKVIRVVENMLLQDTPREGTGGRGDGPMPDRLITCSMRVFPKKY